MDISILVAYSSKHGATRQIAERIGEKLRACNLGTTVAAVEHKPDIIGHSAAVIGSAVYFGHWRREAVDFVRLNRPLLETRQVWLFSSGPLGDPSLVDPKPVAELIDEVDAIGHRVFDGALDTKSLSLLEATVVGMVARQTKPHRDLAGDFRDWDAIDEWAGEIAEHLLAAPAEEVT